MTLPYWDPNRGISREAATARDHLVLVRMARDASEHDRPSWHSTSRRAPNGGQDENAARATGAAGTDHEFLQRLRRGETAAFAALLAETVPALRRYAFRFLHDAGRSEDLVQDVLTRFWERRETLVVTTTIRGYLFGAVRNAALNERQHERVVRAHEAAHLLDVTNTPLAPDDPVLGRVTVEALLATLPERRREAVVLRYLGELSYAEVAAIMGTTRVNAERLVARALETLRETLDRLA